MGRVLVALLSVAALAGLCWLWWGERRTVVENEPLRADAAPRSSPATAEPAMTDPVPPADELQGAKGAEGGGLEGRRAQPESVSIDEIESADDLVVVVVDPAGAPIPGVKLS